MKIIVVASHKGGVGKTAIVYHCAYILKKVGYKVLACDLDGQGNLTQCLRGTGIPTVGGVPRNAEMFGFDAVFIDCHPGQTDSVRQSLSIADLVIIPVETDQYVIGSIGDVMQSMHGVKSRGRLLCVPVNRYNGRAISSMQILGLIQSKLPGVPVITIPQSIVVRNSTMLHRPLDEKSPAYQPLKEISDLIIEELKA